MAWLAAGLARTAAGGEGLALALSGLRDRRDRRGRHPARHPGRPRRGRGPDRGASGPFHRDGHAPPAGAAVRHPRTARSGRNGARVVLGRGTKRHRPAGGIPRPAWQARMPPPGATPRPPSARCAAPLTAGAASGASCWFLPPWSTWRAWPPSPVTKLRRPPPCARRAPSWAGGARRSLPPRSATPRASSPGTGASSPTPSTWSAKPPCSGTGQRPDGRLRRHRTPRRARRRP